MHLGGVPSCLAGLRLQAMRGLQRPTSTAILATPCGSMRCLKRRASCLCQPIALSAALHMSLLSCLLIQQAHVEIVELIAFCAIVSDTCARDL